ncbi:MAG: hypothetical protein HUJ70_02340 [Pseudobutyrivibrio sp.]|nr:hypothetical protein [Pseudobutyrivibrio sp.]
MESQNEVYIGIDINNRSTLLSFYKPNMEEPVTVSTVVGSENYSIPTLLAKKKGIGQWFYGDEAQRKVKFGEAVAVSDVLNLALSAAEVTVDGQIYEARELLVLYFKKLFSIPGVMAATERLKKLIICVDQMSLEMMELMTYVASRLDISAERLSIIDRQESFYYYGLSQKKELLLYDIVLFDFSGSNLVSNYLTRNQNTRPQVISIDTANHGEIEDNRDSAFDAIVKDRLSGNLVSAVYLVGDGFEGNWMKTSLSTLCKGRKVFMGNNLYSKGACYCGAVKDGTREWPFIYIGANELKLNLSIKILDENELKFITLIDAGESWYEAKGECEVILDGEPDIEFYIQRPESREAHVEVLELTDLPERENRTTRLKIDALPVSDREIDITIFDMGFGEISPATGMTWKHTIALR